MKKLVTIVCSTLLVVLAAPAAGAAEPVRSEVSVNVWPQKGVFGFVESPRKGCEAKREVRIFRQANGGPKAIGTGRTAKTGNGFLWSLKSRKARTGTIVAAVEPSARCDGDRARTEAGLVRGDIPECPSLADVCNLTWTKGDDIDSYSNPQCRTFGKDSGRCKIEIDDGRVPFCCWAAGMVDWDTPSFKSKRRNFRFWSWDYISPGQPERNGPNFAGWMPSDSSPNFYVNTGKLPPYTPKPDIEWYTPEIDGAAAGSPGGPLYINWHAQLDNHFYFEVGGFLYRKK